MDYPENQILTQLERFYTSMHGNNLESMRKSYSQMPEYVQKLFYMYSREFLNNQDKISSNTREILKVIFNISTTLHISLEEIYDNISQHIILLNYITIPQYKLVDWVDEKKVNIANISHVPASRENRLGWIIYKSRSCQLHRRTVK
jgi:hypothetical protein